MRPGRGFRRARAGQLGQVGLTLIELMVAQALGLMLLLALMSAWGGGRAAHRHQQSGSAVQEAGRIALELMASDLRMAGYAGCGNAPYLNHLSVPGAVSPPPALFYGGIVVAAIDRPIGTSDTITILGGSPEAATLSAAMPDAHTLPLASAGVLGKMSPGDLLLLSDCARTEVVRVRSVNGHTVSIDPPGQWRFGADALVMRYQQVQYRVAGGELRRNGTAIVAGADDLQIQYGLAGAGQPVHRYVSDPEADVGDVAAIRLALDLRDGDVARSFGTTILLRNRAH